MYKIDINQAQTQLESLLQSALRGDEIIITQNDQPVLKLVRLTPPSKRRQSGSAKGLIWISDDFDQPLQDFSDYIE
jgi:antitoxin (DNA-binding transcriptional repressor) of toxin-antitoxin stability system